uniref:SCAN box domain-containing protein n=1 Tax=Knipowitschia caucasica TaxID=637954 RepID=A0AAV2J000_KNICA
MVAAVGWQAGRKVFVYPSAQVCGLRAMCNSQGALEQHGKRTKRKRNRKSNPGHSRSLDRICGKALEAYSAMDEERAHCYRDLKEALLAKFDISPETYRQQFRSSTLPSGESPTETYHRLRGLYRRWIRPEERTKEEVGEAIIMEQLLRVFPFEVRTWVKEREPGDGLTAAKLAVQYLNARKGGPARIGTTAQRGPAQPLLPRPPRQDSYPDRQDQPYLVSVGVVENLPVDAILGWDLPVLMDLLNKKVSEESVQPLPDLDSSLCEGGTKGPKKSRRQRRAVSNATSSSHNQSYCGSTGNWVGCQTELAADASVLTEHIVCLCALYSARNRSSILSGLQESTSLFDSANVEEAEGIPGKEDNHVEDKDDIPASPPPPKKKKDLCCLADLLGSTYSAGPAVRNRTTQAQAEEEMSRAVSNATSSSHNQSYCGSTGNWVGCQTELAADASVLTEHIVCLCALYSARNRVQPHEQRSTEEQLPPAGRMQAVCAALWPVTNTRLHDSVKLIKFADDTTLIGLISNNDESAYRREVDRLVSWCSGNNLELNAQKTVEMIVDFRKSTVPPPPPSVMDSPITSVESFRFLGTTITQDLKWEPTISSLIKKAQQRMYFLRQLRKAKLPAQMLVQFYTAIIESILTSSVTSSVTSSITVWFAGATVRDKQRLQRIVRSAEEVIGRSLPSLQDLALDVWLCGPGRCLYTQSGRAVQMGADPLALSCY